MKIQYITANWPAPVSIKSAVTLRSQGFSTGEYAALNLSAKTGDDLDNIIKNKQILQNTFTLSEQPYWINQVHGNKVVWANPEQLEPTADAVITNKQQTVCAILTADCLPVLFCDVEGNTVAAAHAGWRGLASGILENTVKTMNIATKDIMVWLGPAISQKNFKIGLDVYKQLLRTSTDTNCFKQLDETSFLADLYQIATNRLRDIGVSKIYTENFCTYEQQELFYSFRRDGAKTGRMASLIWIN